MTSFCRAESALTVIWDVLFDMGGAGNSVELRAMGALSLGSRVLSGLCCGELGVTEEEWTSMGEMVAHYPRSRQMRTL